MIGSKFSCYVLFQPITSGTKPNRAQVLYRLGVITSSFDWFTGLSLSFLIGQSNWFWFRDTRLKLTLFRQSKISVPGVNRLKSKHLLAVYSNKVSVKGLALLFG